MAAAAIGCGSDKVASGADLDGGGADIDGGDPSDPRYLVPLWVKTAASVAFQPSVAVAADGTVLATATMKPSLVLGAGEPGETSFSGNFEPAIGWLDGADGHLLRARQIAAVDAGAAGTATVDSVAVDVAGNALVAGDFGNSQTFFPGTAQATTRVAETKLNASLDYARDPWIARYDNAGGASPLTFGRTPGPLTKTWHNWSQGISPVASGGATIVGRFEDAGFVFGHGRAGAKTLASTGGGSYFARLDADGNASWLVEHSGNVSLRSARGTTAGEVYGVGEARGTVTLYAGTPSAVTLPSWPDPNASSGPRRYVATKATPAGAAAWIRTVEVPYHGKFDSAAVRADGSLLMVGTCDDRVTVRDVAGTVLHQATFASPQECAVSLAADGAFEWVRPLGDGVFSPVPALYGLSAVVASPRGEAWVIAVAASGASLPRETGTVVLPATKNPSTADADAALSVLFRLSRAGTIERVDVLGENFFVTSAALAPEGALVLGGTYSKSGDFEVLVGGNNGTRVPLPAALEGLQRAIFMKVSPVASE